MMLGTRNKLRDHLRDDRGTTEGPAKEQMKDQVEDNNSKGDHREEKPIVMETKEKSSNDHFSPTNPSS